jgi:2-polyprenyl-6-methoxyphenol hydroxylase-like FAD-dependent oxidoreductase
MHATIVGAGIAGLGLAHGLRSIGFDLDVYEQAPELKPLGAGITLMTNGLRALQPLGLYDAVSREGKSFAASVCSISAAMRSRRPITCV